MKVFFFVLVFALFAFAEKPIASFSASPSFSGIELFSHLDEVGDKGNWMRLDTLSIKDSAIEKILKKHKGFLAVWVLHSKNQKPKIAVLSQVKQQEKLNFYEIEKLSAKPEPLSVHRELYPELILSDYQGVSTNEFVHKDEPTLKLKISDKSLNFSYSKPDQTPLRFEPNFKKLSFEEKARIVEEYKDFFMYEYSLMLRAFVQSTRGIFNWQAFHWYLPEWNSRYLISTEEIQALLERGYSPTMFRIFFAKTSRNVLVEMKTNGNGYYEMSVRMP